MPFYEYECSNCKFYTEVMQKITDPPLEKCPSCGKKTLKKLVSAPVFRLKGGGLVRDGLQVRQGGQAQPGAGDKEPSRPRPRPPRSRPRARPPSPALIRGPAETPKSDRPPPASGVEAAQTAQPRSGQSQRKRGCSAATGGALAKRCSRDGRRQGPARRCARRGQERGRAAASAASPRARPARRRAGEPRRKPLAAQEMSLRRYLVAGMLVWLPILATIWVVTFIMHIMDRTLLLLPPCLPSAGPGRLALPGLGAVFAFLIVLRPACWSPI